MTPGYIKIFEEITGAAQKRQAWVGLKVCAAGVVLVGWQPSRLGRSLGHPIELLRGVAERGIQFHALSEHLDTTTPTGKPTFR